MRVSASVTQSILRLMRLTALIASTLACLPVFANDTAVAGIGGTVQPIPGEHPTIQMVRETVRLDLYSDYYDTTADFAFANRGTAASVQMGFPERGYGDIGREYYKKKSGFKNFSTTVDGRSVAASRRFASQTEDGDYLAYWTKTVTFQAGQTKHVQVRYRSNYGGVSSGGMNSFVAYNFTGKNWKDKVLESRLVIQFHQPGTWAARGKMYDSKGEEIPGVLIQSGSTLTGTWKNWEAQADFRLDVGTAPQDFLVPLGKDHQILAGFPGSGPVFQMSNPGKTPAIYNFLPPILRRGGQLYVRASDLEALLYPDRYDQPVYSRDSVVVDFQTQKRTATVATRGKRFEYTVPKSGMSPSSGGAFLLAGERGMFGLYIPLQPIVTGLGGKVVESPDRQLSLSLPPRPGSGSPP